MKRKEDECTRVFDKHSQMRLINESKMKYLEEQKEWINKELDRKTQLGHIAKQNFSLAQNKIDQMMVLKDLDRKEEENYLENGLKLFDLNQKRFKDIVKKLDMKRNGKTLDKL